MKTKLGAALATAWAGDNIRSELEQAMKPFRQVSTGTPRNRGDGTGLGLPLTKAMVDANRAQFAISSTPNEGTLVEVTFPSPRVLAD